MKGLSRRLRGILGTGLSWALGFGGLYGGIHLLLGRGLGWVLEAAFEFAIPGFALGVVFEVILGLAERHPKLQEPSWRKLALGAGLGGLLVAGAVFVLASWAFGTGAGVVLTLFGASYGGACVAVERNGNLAMIRKADEDSPPLIRGQ